MAQILKIDTTKEVTPKCYAYTTPGVTYHDGWTKIGYTERDDVEARVREQTHTAGIKYVIEWSYGAFFHDNSTFRDTDFHAYLEKQNIERESSTEWFHILPKPAEDKFKAFRADKGILQSLGVVPYKLRNEQDRAVDQTKDYFKENADPYDGPEFLWNAKPRFGKTLATYDLCKRMGAKNILIVTNRPAIANSWYNDYVKFLGTESGYYFVSETDALKKKPFVLTRKQCTDMFKQPNYKGCIEFVSLQDLKGSIYFGGQYDKLVEISSDPERGLLWDILVVDEAHEGVDTQKTSVAFDHIKRKFTLHLSGTPFKALANSKFEDKAIFNWTYADEQDAKRNWDDSREEENPYAVLPQLNLYTYQMSEIVKEQVAKGEDFYGNGETAEYAFDLNEFFETKSDGTFKYDKSVDAFLNALVTQKKFPFSTPELRNELKHTFWLLNYVDSAKALAKKLENHPIFKEYKVVLAAGNGKVDDFDETKKSFDKVVDAIKNNEKTITLSVGQLTTGVTIPEWTAVLMLSNLKSPALYMQAAFRAQNPCLFREGKKLFRKENAYVFDFDPARTLTIVEEFANGLYTTTSGGHGDTSERKKHVKKLLNFFPVYGEDDEGEMIELDAEKVLTIPRKIHAVEVVHRGFMSNFLFQNISNIFSAPKEVQAIIQQFDPIKEPIKVNDNTAEELGIDENGEASVPDSVVIGQAQELFGNKIYSSTEQNATEAIDKIIGDNDDAKKSPLDEIKDIIQNTVTAPLIDTAKEQRGDEITKATQQKIERTIKADTDAVVTKAYADWQIDVNITEQERKKALKEAATEHEKAKIEIQFAKKQEELKKAFTEDLKNKTHDIIKKAGETIVAVVELDKRKKAQDEIEGAVRDRLRGFSRTIPSFLMAYGDENTTLENFDQIIPDDVFKEVTSISLKDFRFLRDGGDYTDSETGQTKHFEGKLFDPIVFNDSVQEFLRLKKKLGNYFDESNKEDIFDYIPPQKTNQIFTPKKVVKEMVANLTEEAPGCFDDPDKTFIDLYMKSGLYITEIVKRLYQSEKMRKIFPDDKARLQHIFEKQVYGLAPTEIIYRIATNYILGFDGGEKINKHNFKCFDTLPPAQAGTMSIALNNLYGDK